MLPMVSSTKPNPETLLNQIKGEMPLQIPSFLNVRLLIEKPPSPVKDNSRNPQVPSGTGVECHLVGGHPADGALETRPTAAVVFAADHPVSALGVASSGSDANDGGQSGTGRNGLGALSKPGHSLHVVDVGAGPYPEPVSADGVTWTRHAVAGECSDLVTKTP